MAIVAAAPGGIRSSALASAGAGGIPTYSNSAAITGSAILVAALLIVLIGMAIAWWRSR
ncbi:hypothetical protein [Mycolicibacterium sphagni]|uniref:hypothetical protein n=1 Tax=Mycolicibacterium sphagni TaxID=1786 RepID=UPI0021F31909|nr:hypothetical protein [Mycolicibacterium sphagni]MCV7178247.1 hypothetical protein [Mycolicibacterium sphagni]